MSNKESIYSKAHTSNHALNSIYLAGDLNLQVTLSCLLHRTVPWNLFTEQKSIACGEKWFWLIPAYDDHLEHPMNIRTTLFFKTALGISGKVDFC